MSVYINRIGTAVPPNDVHVPFVAFARTLLRTEREQVLFDRMAERAGIAHRFSFFRPGRLDVGEVDADGFFVRGAFPSTAQRMRRYQDWALRLALDAVADLGIEHEQSRITHLIVASCTGFTAPGLDLQLAAALGLPGSVRRSIIGFMGCAAAVPALRAASEAVLGDPASRVLVVNLELCTLHMQETPDLETILSFLLFGDGASAALVTAEPVGAALEGFHAEIIPDSVDLITWHIGDQGFDMHLSGKVPGRIAQALRANVGELLGAGEVDLWAVHAGGRTVLDAVQIALRLRPEALAVSRAVLHDYGNLSSATIMFVMQRMLAGRPGHGVAMAFGPGMVAETFRFQIP